VRDTAPLVDDEEAVGEALEDLGCQFLRGRLRHCGSLRFSLIAA
jgi:hypothetical protein